MPFAGAVLEEALEFARPWRRRKNVVSVAIGQIQRKSVFLKGRVGIVVLVERKLSPEELGTRRLRAFPQEIRVSYRGRNLRVPVDVQETGGVHVGEFHGLVGLGLLAGGRRGTVGAVVDVPSGVQMLVAGHVAGSTNTRVRVELPDGQLVRGATTWVSSDTHPRLDHALVALDDGLPSGGERLCSGGALRRVRPITTSLVGEVVHLKKRECVSPTQTLIVRHIRLTGDFPVPGGNRRIHNLVTTDRATERGDSGTLLYDQQLRAVATLVGAIGPFSYFTPCDYAFEKMGAELHQGLGEWE